MRGTNPSDLTFPSQKLFENLKQTFQNLLTKPLFCAILYSQGVRGTNLPVILSRRYSFQKIFPKSFENLLTMAERCVIL